MANQISRAGGGVNRPPADMGSVARKPENFACKDASEGSLPSQSSLPPSVYLYGLSQAPLAMHRRRFRFPALPMVERGASPRETRKGRAVG